LGFAHGAFFSEFSYVWINLAISKSLLSSVQLLALYKVTWREIKKSVFSCWQNPRKESEQPSQVGTPKLDAMESEDVESEHETEQDEEMYKEWLQRLESAQSALTDGMSFVAICFAFGCAIPVLYLVLPLGAFLLSRALRFMAAQEKPLTEHMAYSMMVRLPTRYLVWIVRLFAFLTSAVVLVDLEFGLGPCLAYIAAVSATSVIFTVVRANEGGQRLLHIVCSFRRPFIWCEAQPVASSECQLPSDPGIGLHINQHLSVFEIPPRARRLTQQGELELQELEL